MDHVHTRRFKDVSLDEVFSIGQSEGWSDKFIHMIWDMRREAVDLETQGWCERCFREQFSKGWPIFRAMEQAQGKEAS